MTETSPVILNDGSVAKDTALETDEIEKNIRIIITKLKGKYMNEGRISMWCILYCGPIVLCDTRSVYCI